jgi:hypothetical protein
MPAIVTILADNKIYLMMNDKTVQGFDTVNEAINHFEVGYNNNHARGYEASMSACLNFIQFSPSIHEWEHENLTPLVDEGVIELDNFRGYSLSSVSGRMLGAICTGENALTFHESGITPKLIK